MVEAGRVPLPGWPAAKAPGSSTPRASLWRTYTTLTDVEALFRSLKSELGLRPTYHHKPVRSEVHPFLTVIFQPVCSATCGFSPL